MAPVKQLDAPRASAAHRPQPPDDELFALTDFDDELRQLSAANQELLAEFHRTEPDQAGNAIARAVELAPADAEVLERLRLENAELKARVQELEALGAGQGEELWLERQREYEMLLEEKSEVIRELHQRIQESQECAIGGEAPAPAGGASGVRLGQAEEILRLKREMEEQRRQLEQDEEDMMAQMRQMEMTMAKERAEMARQRQEVQRLQAELTREAEQSSRDPELRERLNSLRRNQEPRPGSNSTEKQPPKAEKSSGFLSRLFG